MRISDWSSDVCSSDLHGRGGAVGDRAGIRRGDRAVLLERRLQGRNFFRHRLERLLVARDRLGALLAVDFDVDDFEFEAAVLVGLLRALQRFDCNASCASRVKPYFSPVRSANAPIDWTCAV